MELTEHEIELLDDMIEVQKNHAERCLELKGSVPERQRKKDLERIKLLEKIKQVREGGQYE